MRTAIVVRGRCDGACAFTLRQPEATKTGARLACVASTVRVGSAARPAEVDSTTTKMNGQRSKNGQMPGN